MNFIMRFVFLNLFLLINMFYCYGSFRPKRHVLFIGNSLTAYHDMPQTLQKMIDEQQLNIEIEQLTYGGFRLYLYATYIEYEDTHLRRIENNEVPVGVKTILSKKWDYVILQEGGGAVLIPYFRIYSFEPSIIFLDSIIKSVKSKTVIYQGYATNKYPHYGCEKRSSLEDEAFYTDSQHTPNILVQCCTQYFNNSTDEFQEIKTEYDKMAKKLNAGLVKVGYAFEEFKKISKNINLYENDSHPSAQGSYLIACLFYKYITGRTLNNVKYSAELDTKQAKIIRKFANTIK